MVAGGGSAPGHDGGSGSGGSGFVVDGAKGLIVTTDFVLEGSTKITVQQGDRDRMRGKLVAIDETNHIGLIQISDHRMPALTFCETAPRMGDQAYVVSYPFRLGPLAFAGIVSGSGTLDEMPFPMLMTDAGMHLGSAGSPVVSASGCVMAMSYAKMGMPNDTPEFHLGFAVPAEHVQAALPK